MNQRQMMGRIFAAALLCGGASASAVYSFCGVTNCTNGAGPSGALIRDTDGTLYGTVTDGGAAGGGGGNHGSGEVFVLAPQ